MGFKEQLIQRRKQMGLSQEQLGYRVGVSRQTVSKWELGETTPEMEKLIQLSRLFGCSIDQLVENEDGEESSSSGQADPGPQPHPGGFGPWIPWQYEYKSPHTLFGLPLIHIHIGYGLCTAKGIFALGNYARGVFALGGISAGVFALGGLSFGLVSLGGLALGLLFAFGGLAVGAVAVGGFALGLLALGGGAVGVYAIGGGAFASRVAAGGWAYGPVAIGDQVRGAVCLPRGEGLSPEQIRQAIQTQFPGTWKILLDLFSML